MDGVRFLWRHDEIMESSNPLTSAQKTTMPYHTVHHTTPTIIS